MRPYARNKARIYVLQSLYQWVMSGNSPSNIKQQILSEKNLNRFDVEYYCTLFQGITNDPEAIDKHMLPYLDRSVDKLSPIELCVMRIALFELERRTDIPYRVIINEALNLTKKFGAQDGFKYVNGILDKAAKNLRPSEANTND